MQLDGTHDPARRSWVAGANAADADFPIQNLPLCIFRRPGGHPRGGIGIGDQIVDLEAVQAAGLLSGLAAEAAEAACSPTLNALMALGPKYRAALRSQMSDLLGDGPAGEKARDAGERILVPMATAQLELPAFIRAFSDFTSSPAHTKRLRGALPEVLLRLPVAYNGRASSIRLDGTPVRRPMGQFRADDEIRYGPEPRLDFELELASFVGLPNSLGEPVPVAEAADHLFGFVLVNDWSARGIQLFENMLGPFLGKSFLTTISPWIVTPEALAPFRVPATARDEPDARAPAHLQDETDQRGGGIDLELTADIQTERMRAASVAPERIVTTNFSEMIWTFAQMLAHHSSNGCNLETGDLLASGTVSGSTDQARACMAEMNEHEKAPVQLANGETRSWLEDGDEIVFRARASRPGFVPIGFGTCAGRITPAH